MNQAISVAIDLWAIGVSFASVGFSAKTLLRSHRLRDDWVKHEKTARLILHRLDEIIATDRLIEHRLVDLMDDPRIDDAFKVNIGRWLELRRRLSD